AAHRCVQRHGGPNERLQRLFIDLVALMDIDGAPLIAFEAGVEEVSRVLERGPLGESQLHGLLVGLAGADDSVMLPHRNAQHRVRRLSPFHLLDDVGVGLPDETSDASERLAAPILQLLDSRINQRRGRVSSYSLRAALSLVHGCCLSLRRWYLLVEEHAPYIAAPRVQCCTERPRRIFLVVPARGRLVSEKFDIRRDPCYADAHKCDFRPMSTRSILRADRLKRLFEPDPADFG